VGHDRAGARQICEVAAAAITREALRRALMPVINSISVTGMVSLPGRMTGQILGGVPLAEVVKCQILVMFLQKNGTLRPCPLSTRIRLLLRNNHPSPPGCD
jgi:putative ABC transport system permease protein